MIQAAESRIQEVLGTALDQHGRRSELLIPILQDINHSLGYLPRPALEKIAVELQVPVSRVYHVATFYKAFGLQPRGRHILKVCLGTACHVRGAPKVLDELCRVLDVKPGGTTGDGEFTVETVNCLGACALGPVVMVDGAFRRAAPGTIDALLTEIREQPVEKPEPRAVAGALCEIDTSRIDREQVALAVCGGSGCQAWGCQAVAEALEQELTRSGIRDKIEFRVTGCHGFCEQGPLVLVRPDNTLYRHVKPEDAADIIEQTVLQGHVIDRLVYRSADGEAVPKENDIPFYAHQSRVVFGDNGRISPESIDDYVETCGGYGTLQKALDMEPALVVREVLQSGLRGRGGGGFPTGRKWDTCRNAKGNPKYLVCNADEGDPGAYMDRSLLEGNPHRVIEGMLIGAYAIGASQGFVYVRDEYPLAVKHIRLAVDQARARGLLGSDILDSGFDFDLTVVRGGGAFVCGEETALIASLKGLPGEARSKYIFPAERGFNNLPTVINNVETWANISLILEKGAEWYAGLGRGESRGTKIFSLVGKVVNTGLVEVPLGTTLRTLVYDIGGGIPDGKQFKAIQAGGPSGGCLPEAQLDLPVGFDELTEAGAMMGSGGLIVMDETSCMVDVARYFVDFLKEESCGKCLPCREGLVQMQAILDDICAGRGRVEDVDALQMLAITLAEGSLCALGGTAPNPVLSTLRYFRDEYDAHIKDHRCPGKVCKDLITYEIVASSCVGCQACARKCPVQVISGDKKKPHTINQDGCIKCGACLTACRFDAVKVQ